MTSSLPARAAVVGGGTMGSSLAAAFTLAGIDTTLIVRRPDGVEATRTRALARIEAHHRLGLADRSAASAAERLLALRVGSGGGPYRLVVEAISEDVAAKRALLGQVEAEFGPDGVLCTNTSSLAIAELADVLADPTHFAGWHWFHPADLVALVEVVPGEHTSESTLERLRAWSVALGKTPVVLGRDIEGFVANRLQYALLREAYALVETGVCSVEDVDRAVVAGLGQRWSTIGPFRTVDLAGLDVHAAIVRQLFPRLATGAETPPLLEATVRAGDLGAKSGTGLRGGYAPAQLTAIVDGRDAVLARAAQPDRGQAADGEALATVAASDRPFTPEECADRASQAAALVDLDALDRGGPGEARLLWRDAYSEAWLNTWWQPRDTGYHDHDGSCVGVHVIAGRAWNEPLLAVGGRRTSEYGPGESFWFPGDGIHRMDHEPGAITIHVYSPPIRSIGHYDLVDGRLQRTPCSPDDPSEPSSALLAALEEGSPTV